MLYQPLQLVLTSGKRGTATWPTLTLYFPDVSTGWRGVQVVASTPT